MELCYGSLAWGGGEGGGGGRGEGTLQVLIEGSNNLNYNYPDGWSHRAGCAFADASVWCTIQLQQTVHVAHAVSVLELHAACMVYTCDTWFMNSKWFWNPSVPICVYVCVISCPAAISGWWNQECHCRVTHDEDKIVSEFTLLWPNFPE